MMCPHMMGNVLERLAYRYCHLNGTWADYNYTGCKSNHIQTFRDRLGQDVLNVKIQIALWIRFIETICLILSTFLGSWTTFLQWRHKDLSLTKEVLHIRLFSSTTLHAGLKLFIYLDQKVSQAYPQCATLIDAGFLCQYAYVLSEFTKSMMISYMVCEGIHLQSLVDTTRFPKEVDIRVFDSMSFAFSSFFVGLWALISHFTLSTAVCWWGYVFREEFWFVEAPRIFIIVVNGCFLVKVVVGVVRKLRATNAPPGEQVKKGTKAAVVLMFLFGVPHLIPMIYSAADLQPIGFGIFSVATTLFSASQGFCVALLYCREMILDSLKPIFKIIRCECCIGMCTTKSINNRSTSRGSRSVTEHEKSNQLQSSVHLDEQAQNSSSPSVSNSRKNLLGTITPPADITVSHGGGPVQCFATPDIMRPVHPIFEKLNNFEDSYSYGSRGGDLHLSLDNVEVEQIEIPREYLTKDWKASDWKARCSASHAFSKSLAFSNQNSSSTKIPRDKDNQQHSKFRRSSSVGAGETKLIPLSTSKSTEVQSSKKINEDEPKPGTSLKLTHKEQQVVPRLTPLLHQKDLNNKTSEHAV